MKLKKYLSYFSKFEWGLWGFSFCLILISFLCSGDFYPLTLVASLVGVTALIFIAKGNVIGQFLIILFSILYGIISIRNRYYGEMATYLFMSAPSAIIACIHWLKNPSDKGFSEVKIGSLSKKKLLFTCGMAAVVTVVFYFVLKYFHTNVLWLSTVSVTTSFFAAILLIYRSPYYALAYVANDLVLVGLWIFAAVNDLSYLPMIVCFSAFLCHDTYSFYNWKKMEKRQKQEK
ncbi:MAG: nicotinamide mononucleotide transporter [Clostridia bacterium]|nr:nicotinamide mononucleotide transporter [Clostridia bacterium]